MNSLEKNQIKAEDKKQLSTLEVQEAIHKRNCEEFKRRGGKTHEQLVKEANTPKPAWGYPYNRNLKRQHH